MNPAGGLRRAVWLALWPIGLAVGLGSLAIARSSPGFGFAASSLWTAAAALAAGWALITVGLIAWARRPASRFGLLLAAGGIGWCLQEWNNAGIGSELAFAIGLVLYAVGAPLVAHAALAYPSGRLPGWPDSAGLTAAYLGAGLVLGLLPALFFDPASQGCGQCPRNLLLVRDDPDLFSGLNRVGVQLGLGWSLALIVLLARQLARSTPALVRLRVPVAAAAAAFLGLVAWDFRHSLDRGTLASDPTDRRLWLGQAAALIALAAGVGWSWLRGRRTRDTVARLVVELAGSPAPGGLRDVLAGTLGDPSLQLAYPLADERRVDAHGRPLTLDGTVTPLVRGGRQVAFLAHRAGLLDDPGLAEEVAAASRLALEHERLQAQLWRSCRTCVPLAHGSSPPVTPNAGGWSATCTTAPSSGWLASRSRCGLPAPNSNPPSTPANAPASTKQKPSCASPWGSFASSPTGSSRPCLPTKASQPPWRHSPKTPRCRSGSRPCPRGGWSQRLRRRPTSSSQRSSATAGA